jgi:4-hydroxythreonine-4-phosphate dehydrogenase
MPTASIVARPRIALTQGDPAGIGPELCLRVIRDAAVLDVCRPILVGDLAVLRQVGQRLGLALPERVIGPEVLLDAAALDAAMPAPAASEAADDGRSALLVDCAIATGPVEPGRPATISGEASYRYIELAARAAQAGTVGGICTAPITKATLKMAGIHEPGHTEILARLTGCDNYAMMLYSPRLAVSLVTIHQSLASVPGDLKTEEIRRVIGLTGRALRAIRGREPRMAILGLNPHAGEGGMFGREEIEIIAPAVALARADGWNVEGPIPPDAAFMPHNLARFDGHVTMYHDQGLIPFKMTAMAEGVNVTLGLPIMRTSVDHGTAYDIAWQGKADPSSLVAALALAARLAAGRE